MMPGGSRQKGFALLYPWLWLGFVVMLALAGFTGYRQGVKVTKADYEQAAQKAMTAMIERHNELAKADANAVVAAEKRRQQWRLDQQEKRHALELEAVRNHRAECAWSELERGLLNDLVESANGSQAQPAAGLPGGVRPPAAASGPDGSGGQGLGGKRGLRFWRMSQPTR